VCSTASNFKIANGANNDRCQEYGHTLARNRYPSLGVYETMPSKISNDTDFAVLDLNVRCIIG